MIGDNNHMEFIDHKVAGGKLLRLQADIKNDAVIDISINGDFFIYPEEAIADIEKILAGKKIGEIEAVLQKFLNARNLEIIGFRPRDLREALEKSKIYLETQTNRGK
jgi:lipoate---protein ligase